MWLASFSRWTTKGVPYPTTEWTKRDFDIAEEELRKVLTGVGDEGYERFFRMVLTACFQRGLSDEELMDLPSSCRLPPEHLAGGSLEVLYHRGPPQPLSAMPCENVGREDLRRACPERESLWPRIWLPIDCGECPPCVARNKAETE